VQWLRNPAGDGPFVNSGAFAWMVQHTAVCYYQEECEEIDRSCSIHSLALYCSLPFACWVVATLWWWDDALSLRLTTFFVKRHVIGYKTVLVFHPEAWAFSFWESVPLLS
jgi:hypothetical protein